MQRTFLLRYEVIAYAAIALLALILYTAMLGGTPLTADETQPALAALRVIQPAAPGDPLITDSPLRFIAQAMGFIVLGGTEAGARVLTALAGAALVLSPALFRRRLGDGRALLLSLLLLGSPVVMITARTASPSVWSALLAVLTLWAGWRYAEAREQRYGIAAVALGAALVFLAEPGGIVLAMILAATAVSMRLSAPVDDEEMDEEPRAALPPFPWGLAALAAVLIVLVTGTVFLLYPSGLANVAEVFGGFASGLVTRPADQPVAFTFWISLFYEPWLWLLMLGALVYATIRRRWTDALDRWAFAWAAFAVIAALLYPGARAQHALWITLPFALIISRLAPELFSRYDADDAPRWSRWIVAASALALLAMGSVAFQAFARSLSRSAGGVFNITQVDAINVIVLLIALAFAVVGYFLVRSFWETDGPPLRGAGLALVAFAVVAGVGSGWRTTVTQAGNPVDFWQRSAVSPDTLLIRTTLFDLAERQSRGFAEMPITLVTDGDPLIEWIARDFVNARSVRSLDDIQDDPVILMRVEGGERDLAFGGAYLGQDFILLQQWSLGNLMALEYPAWWSQHTALNSGAVYDEALLWVRQDVWAGIRGDG